MLAASELGELAARYGITRQGTGRVCFERRTRVLTAEGIAAVMRETLGAEAQIEVLDFVRAPVPQGQLVFPAGNLAAAVDGTVMWRGFIRRDEKNRTPVWAKARVRGSFRQVVAVGDLKPGKPIPESAVREETRQGTPPSGAMAERIDQVAGRVVQRIIRAGTPVPLDAVAPPNEVVHGESVSVEVRCGAARLVFDGLAGSDGRKGQVVTVRNPASGKTFRARVEDRRKVAVVTGGCQ
jgi:flagella basal body P-ring formation protein FlgA